jgi:hypothetical protein
MSALEITFVIVAIASFGATAWVAGIVAWRLIRRPRT